MELHVRRCEEAGCHCLPVPGSDTVGGKQGQRWVREVRHVGEVGQDGSDAVWSIPKEEIQKVQEGEVVDYFFSKGPVCVGHGFRCGLGLFFQEDGSASVFMMNANNVTLDLDCGFMASDGEEAIAVEPEMVFKSLPPNQWTSRPCITVPNLLATTDLMILVTVTAATVPGRGGRLRSLLEVREERRKSETEAKLPPEETEPWSLEKALKNLGEGDSEKKTKKAKKADRKEKKKPKKPGIQVITKEESNSKKKTDEEEEKRSAMKEKIKCRKVHLMSDEKEVEAMKM